MYQWDTAALSMPKRDAGSLITMSNNIYWLKNEEDNCSSLFIDPEKLIVLTEKFSDITSAYLSAIDEKNKQILLFQSNFLKYFIDDIFYLNDHSGNKDFNVRYGNLIIRNMVEQLIEFIYLIKNQQYIDEYMGSSIKNKQQCQSDKNLSKVELMKIYGGNRFSTNRPRVMQMDKDIRELYAPVKRNLTLYDIYSILSDRTHNSYFNSLLEHVGKIMYHNPQITITIEQMSYLDYLIEVVIFVLT